MTAIDRATATAFAIAVNRIRPTWDVTGLRAMIENGTPRQATLSQILIAATLMAETGSITKPSADVFRDGPWWDRASVDNKRPEWAANKVACPLHPQHPLGTENCPECQKLAGPPLTPEQIAANANAIRAELTGHGHHRPEPKPTNLTADVSAARAKADQEATS